MNGEREAINTGDCVVVVRWPCCGFKLGYVGTVTALESSHLSDGRCAKCREYWGRFVQVIWVDDALFPLKVLKRIPPLSELEREKRDEEITA